MKMISTIIISLGLFLTTTVIGLRLLTLSVFFESDFGYQLAQSIWAPSILPNFRLSADEYNHMLDVSALVYRLISFTIITDILAILLFMRLRISLSNLIKTLLVLICSLVLGIGLNWTWLFTTFHKVFFPQGNWTFPETSTLIMLYPDSFWQMKALQLLGFHIFTLGLLFFTHRFLNRMASMGSDNKLKPTC